MLANYLSYYDKKQFATREAMLIGRLQCLLPDWEKAAMDFAQSGGFILSDKVSKVKQETLILWGDRDAILEPSSAYRFEEELPRGKLIWVESCGHVPHLEKPDKTAEDIINFINEGIA